MVDTPHRGGLVLLSLLTSNTSVVIFETLGRINYHLRWIFDSEANQHMTNNTKDMVDLVDVSDLKLTVGHPNGTLAKYIGNLKLNSGVMLFNVLVILEYTVSLLYVHKLIKARKFSVGFDETKCYIQDLRKERVLGTVDDPAQSIRDLVSSLGPRPSQLGACRCGPQETLTLNQGLSNYLYWRVEEALACDEKPYLINVREEDGTVPTTGGRTYKTCDLRLSSDDTNTKGIQTVIGQTVLPVCWRKNPEYTNQYLWRLASIEFPILESLQTSLSINSINFPSPSAQRIDNQLLENGQFNV
ncbi:hypothetical protein Tco_0633565 [Tanacetum coccineum]